MRVLVCPLDWGLGHATRCIPVIRALIANGHHVMVGASGGGLHLLQSEFPGLDIFDYPGYKIRYSRSPATFLPVMLLQMPAILIGLLRERVQLRQIAKERKPDLVLSDGRYGVYCDDLPCIFITHQIFLRIPGRFPGARLVTRILLALNERLLCRFREVWIPDYPGSENLSGELSHGQSRLSNLVYIKPLSRFKAGENEGEAGVDVLALVSGPEPQRGIFEKLLRRQFDKMSGTRVLVCGMPSAANRNTERRLAIIPGQLNVYPHLAGEEIALLMRKAKMVVARSGYTSVMEMDSLRVKSVVLIPTPGQSEQEYLADHLERSRIALRMDQNQLDLHRAGQVLLNYSGFNGKSLQKSSGFRKGSETDGITLQEFIRHHPLLIPGGQSE